MTLPQAGSQDRPGHDRSDLRRLAYVDGIRGSAALWVLAYHVWIFGFVPADGSVTWWQTPFAAGHLGVPVFLVVSGFCLAYPYRNEGSPRLDLRRFAVRRAIRILPPYWLVTLFFAAATLLQLRLGIGGVHGEQKPTDLNDLLWHLGLVQNLSAEHFFRINGALWSVALECQLYFAFPILIRFVNRPLWLLVGCAAISVPTWIFALWRGDTAGTTSGFALWLSAPSCLLVFGIGIAACGSQLRILWRGTPLAMAAVAALLASIALDRIDGRFPMVSILLAAVATAFGLVAGGDSPTGRWLGAPWLARIGFVSYTLYLIHNPIVSFAGKLLRPRFEGLDLVLLMAAVGVAIVGLSFLLFPLLEQPFHRAAKRLSRGVAVDPTPSSP